MNTLTYTAQRRWLRQIAGLLFVLSASIAGAIYSWFVLIDLRRDSLADAQSLVRRRAEAERLAAIQLQVAKVKIVDQQGEAVLRRADIASEAKMGAAQNLLVLRTVEQERLEALQQPLPDEKALDPRIYWERPGARLPLNATEDGQVNPEALKAALGDSAGLAMLVEAAKRRAAAETPRDPTFEAAIRIRARLRAQQ